MLNSTSSDDPQREVRAIVRRDGSDAERAGRLARALAPTVYCPESRVDECVAESKQGLAS